MRQGVWFVKLREGRREVNGGKATAAFFVVLVVSFAAMNALPADGLLLSCVQEAVLAVAAVAAVAFACPHALSCKRCTNAVQHEATVGVAVVLVGLLGGLITLAAWGFGDSCFAGLPAFAVLPAPVVIVERLVSLLAICLLTGVFEEAFMRVLGIEAFEGLLRANGESASGATKRAVVLSAALFALLHVGVPDAGADGMAAVQALLKFAQAFLFGLVMGVLYARVRSLWPCVAVHAGFDVLYLGPNVVLTGALPATYASGLPVDTVLLCATTALLAMLAMVVWRSLEKSLP